MRTRIYASGMGVSFFLGVCCWLWAGATLRVDESATRIEWRDSGPVVRLAVQNPSPQGSACTIQAELLDTKDVVRATANLKRSLPGGRTIVPLPLAVVAGQTLPRNRKELLWYRLRYRVTPAAGSTSHAPVEGIIALGQIAPDFFELHAVATPVAQRGAGLLIRVRSIHPVTRKPVGGVHLEGLIGNDEDDAPAWKKSRVVTDSRGYGTLEFHIPGMDGEEDDEAEFDWSVTGRRGVFETTVSGTVHNYRGASVLLLTDKPLYQPGQKLRMRMLALDASRKPVSGAKYSLKIEDPEDSVVFQDELTSSRYGVAHSEWNIPEGLRLGDYAIRIESQRSADSGGVALRQVKISRYELPGFAVSAKPGRPYYLPGQNAQVEVNARYLFGKPVPGAQVRITFESDRSWNYREQEWSVSDDDVAQGNANTEGNFTTQISLKDHFEGMEGEQTQRFFDVKYAAYVTDPASGRTEQRAFSLRLTKDPIHVYFIEAESSPTTGFPLSFYVSTWYADGTPASCDVEVRAVTGSFDEREEGGRSLSSKLAEVRTNLFGVARVPALNLSSLEDSAPGQLQLVARDSRGARGVQTQELSWTERPIIRVETNKSLYAPGEPIEVQLHSNVAGAALSVEILAGNNRVASQAARLRNGRAFLVFPGDPRFQNALHVVAFALGLPASHQWDRDNVLGSRSVLFPSSSLQELSVTLRTARAEYRPGEKAWLNVAVQRSNGGAGRSALGFVAFDRALEERARAEQESGNGPGIRGFRETVEEFLGYDDALAGIRRPDLERLDMSKPLPEGLDLVAEILLNRQLVVFAEQEEITLADPRSLFSVHFQKAVHPFLHVLNERYEKTRQYPKNETELRNFLSVAGQDFGAARDPWGAPLRARGNFLGRSHVLTLLSSGPDKRPDTDDDITVETITRDWFVPLGESVDEAVARFHERTGQYIQDQEVLRAELQGVGIDWLSLRDPWGHPFTAEFAVDRVYYTIIVRSPGPDGLLRPAGSAGSLDDLNLWTALQDYTEPIRLKVERALEISSARRVPFPENEEAFWGALAAEGLAKDALRDPWQQPMLPVFSYTSLFGHPQDIRYYVEGGEPRPQARMEPAGQRIAWIHLRSSGPDRKPGNGDDFTVATFSRPAIEPPGLAEQRSPSKGFALGAGTISGVVSDVTGAVIPRAAVSAISKKTRRVYQAATNELGQYVLEKLPTGFYTVRVESVGFRIAEIREVPVRPSAITRLNTTLQIGEIACTVTVEAAQARVETIQSMRVTTKERDLTPKEKPGPLDRKKQEIATPPLRDYFPETLLWLPELETDDAGKARIELPLAGSITTWKLVVIASNLDGQIGLAEKEIRAFQPFFVEHDPPKVLTTGDEIRLPVLVRNYLEKAQGLKLAMKAEPWFEFLGASEKTLSAEPGAATRDVFSFRAAQTVKDGKQRVTATGPGAGDAIEKTVQVHPDGEERQETIGRILGEETLMQVAIPSDVIPGSLAGTLKIYPNAMAHVVESIESILQRPYGCGEQTTSSTYPNLVLLQFVKHSGMTSNRVAQARANLKMGYERLLTYRTEKGGFAYWKNQPPDLALTAYILQFLQDARGFVNVDENVLSGARAFLLSEMIGGNRWSAAHTSAGSPFVDLGLTAYVARVLSRGIPQSNEEQARQLRGTISRVLDHMQPHVKEARDAYFVAAFALAAQAINDSRASQAVAALKQLAQPASTGKYWDLAGHTPFHAWGTAGRIETTALVLQALADPPDASLDALRTDGLSYLLAVKDHYGAWQTTQATVQVLHAITRLSREAANVSSALQVVVNGSVVRSVALASAGQSLVPLEIALAPWLSAGANQVKLVRSGGPSLLTAQLVFSYYIPWTNEESSASPAALKVEFDTTSPRVGEPVQCLVRVRRAPQSRGMDIAEIGLPPGAEVDRASLGRMRASSYAVDHYEVLPDRVVLYLSPGNGQPQELQFSFRSRYGMKAKSAQSVVYDYYNPEARASARPVLFNVKD